jgi:WD40 repeat protein
VPSVAFADGGREILAVTYDGLVHGWRSEDAAQHPASPSTLKLEGGADTVHEAADGSLVVSRTGSNLTPDHLEVVDRASGQVRQRGPDVGGLPAQTRWSLSQDHRVAVLAGPFENGELSHEVLIWRVGTPVTTLRRVRIGAFAARIVPCGSSTMCVLTDDQRLLRVSLGGAVESDVKLPGNTLDTLGADAAGRRAAVAGDDGLLRLVDTRSGRVLRTFGGPSRDPRVLAMSPDGSRLVGGDVGTVYFWRTDRDALPERYDVHAGRVISAAWSPDGTVVATGAEDGTVVLWDVDGRRRVGAVLNDALGADTSTLWATPDALVVGQFDWGRAFFRLIFVDPRNGSVHPALGSVPGLKDEAIQTARSGGRSSLVVTADDDGHTAVWDSRTYRLLGTVPLPAPDTSHAAYAWVSPDGTTAATIRTGAGAIVFDVASRRVLRTVPLPVPSDPDQLTKVQGWTADGQALLVSRNLSRSGDDLLVVDARTGSVRFRVVTGSVAVGEVAADPAGRFLALSMNDGSVRVVDARDGHPLASPLNASSGSAINVSVSPDGKYLAASGFPPQVTVWDTRTFTRVGVPLPVDANATDARARFTPDGRLVVTTGDVMRLFTIDPQAWLTRACTVAGRTLSRGEFEAALPRLPYRPACAGP